MERKFTEEEAEKLLKTEPLWRVAIAGALYIAIVVAAIVVFLCSCSTTKNMTDQSHVQLRTDSIVTTIDTGTTIADMQKDSIYHETAKEDTQVTNKTIIDSTIINNTVETIITNTVNERGELLGTDKETTRTINRDHWRIENNDTQQTHNKTDSIRSDHNAQLKEKLWNDVQIAVNRFDSIVDNNTEVKTVDSRSWWDKFTSKVGSVLLCIIIGILIAVAARLAWKYYMGK